MKKTILLLDGIKVDIITEQVSKNTFDGLMYEIINWIVYTDKDGVYHPIPYGRLYYETQEFSDEEIRDYHAEFIKDFSLNPNKYFVD